MFGTPVYVVLTQIPAFFLFFLGRKKMLIFYMFKNQILMYINILYSSININVILTLLRVKYRLKKIQL